MAPLTDDIPSGGAFAPIDGTRDPWVMFRHSELPPWALVRQRLDTVEIEDAQASTWTALERVAERLPASGRVCIALGSRGIDRIAEVARAAVSFMNRRGLEVFAVPAMGSHGGATADGQLAVLESLGITEESIGCSIRSSMETVRLAELPGGIPVDIDRHAASEADAIVPINRVKPHTDFSASSESGLLKMIAIGLGKQRGAEALHGEGFARFGELVPAVARLVLERAPIPFGLALVENGRARLRLIEAVPAEAIHQREPELLREAYRFLTRLPVDALDVLVVDRIGKDISGLGMDSNVVGRYYDGPTPAGPSIQRIVVRDLTEETEGNAVGIGMADVVLERAVQRMDAARTYVNCITAKTPEGARIALTVETDRQAIDVAVACCTNVRPELARLMRIRDTKHLEWLYVSQPLLDELPGDRCDVIGPVKPMAFDSAGNLADELPG